MPPRPRLPLLPLASTSRLPWPTPHALIRHGSSSAPPLPPPIPIGLLQRSLLAVGSAITSLVHPERHDMIAVLSETTSGPFLSRLRTRMLSTPSGRSLLRERPRITEAGVDLERLGKMPEGSLGREYVKWLASNKVTPDTRDPVRYIVDPELAYIMQRYRESHDFYHVLLGPFGVSMQGELVVKWFELANFGLPVALLSSVFGPLRLEASERRRLFDTYGGWALRCGGSAQCLIGIEWEKEWEKDINVLRRELGIWRPPMDFKLWRKEGRQLKKEREAMK